MNLKALQHLWKKFQNSWIYFLKIVNLKGYNKFDFLNLQGSNFIKLSYGPVSDKEVVQGLNIASASDLKKETLAHAYPKFWRLKYGAASFLNMVGPSKDCSAF